MYHYDFCSIHYNNWLSLAKQFSTMSIAHYFLYKHSNFTPLDAPYLPRFPFFLFSFLCSSLFACCCSRIFRISTVGLLINTKSLQQIVIIIFIIYLNNGHCEILFKKNQVQIIIREFPRYIVIIIILLLITTCSVFL